MLMVTLFIFSIFIIFQILYIFIPIFLVSDKNDVVLTSKEKSITILIPAYNEEKVINHCLKGIQNVNYTNVEAIFINDGSTDGTFDLLDSLIKLQPVRRTKQGILTHKKIKGIYQSKLYPHMYVIDKVNGGKADALNAGIEVANNDIIVTLDADSVLDYNAMQAINTAFQDETIIAAGGTVQIAQGFHGNYLHPQPTFIISGIIRFQIIQYFTAFYLHKFTQMKFKSITVIAGAFGAFRKYALLEANGYRNTVGEDMDITLRIQSLIKTKYKKSRMIVVPHAFCYTECPSTLRDLFNQRIRWQKAFVDCVWIYRKSFFRKIGFAPSLYLLLDSLLLGTLNAFVMLLIPLTFFITPNNYWIPVGLFSFTFLLATYQSIAAILISRRFGVKYTLQDYAKISTFIPLEIITYRLLGIAFVTMGTILYLKSKDGWHVSRRVGIGYQTYEKNEESVESRRRMMS
ncbi:glycosyltransferase [Pontibacillus yanchengensis]|uniref:Glycosyltransferase n=1 Tax=Pontibacillus yanchengensis TaxID=462910 RepID=A0A6I5A0C5_9BACI|nr:glycosyltransferase family 2 protein [Pontibacillus yanchengensis]MYL33860.1 glycosyltransferase [Pontibacillus yanchengensis]